VRADRIHLVNVDRAEQLVPEVERLHGPATLELVQAVSDAMNRAAERLAQTPGIAIVVPIGQDRVRGSAVSFEELEAIGRNHRIEDDPLTLEVVRAHLSADPLADSGPVPETR